MTTMMVISRPSVQKVLGSRLPRRTNGSWQTCGNRELALAQDFLEVDQLYLVFRCNSA